MIAQAIGIKLKVPFDQYFIYAVPATCFYILGLILPLRRQKTLDFRVRQIFDRLSEVYRHKQNLGISLLIFGLPFWVFQNSVPEGLSFIFYLLAYFLFIGICILLFTEFIFKWVFIAGGIFLLVVTTLLNGMIGTVIFWLFIIGVLYSCKRNLHLPYWGKLVVILAGMWLVAVLQIVKTEYRIKTWDITKSDVSSKVDREITQDPGLLYDLFLKQIVDYSGLESDQVKIALVERLNQGGLVSLTMRYIPRRRPYGAGEVTLGNTLIAFIPRILWPDKPVIGQAAYFRKFTGIQLGKFHSATLGPLGDAYADYGKGGIIFLFLFGLFIGRLYLAFINRSQIVPTMLLWFMGIYFTTITVTEISVAIYLNAVIKFLIFIWTGRFILVRVFHLKL